MTILAHYDWAPLASPAAGYNALAAIFAARGGVQLAGGTNDEAVGAGISTTQNQNAVFMWANSLLAVYDVDQNIWRGPIPIPAGFTPSAFAELFNSRYSVTYDKATRTIWKLDFQQLRATKVYPHADKLDLAGLPSVLDTHYSFATTPLIYSSSMNGVCCMPVNGIFTETIMLFFDYRGGPSVRLFGAVKVSDQLLDFNSRQNGSLPASGGTCLPGRIYYQSGGALQRTYRPIAAFAALGEWTTLQTTPGLTAWFGDAGAANRYYTRAPQLNGFGGGGTDASMFTLSDTNFEATLNAMVNTAALGTLGLTAIGPQQMETGNPPPGPGGQLVRVGHYPFDLLTQSFRIPLVAVPPAGFSPRQAWAVLPLQGVAAILDDTGAFFLLDTLIYDVTRFTVYNWNKDIRS